LDINGSYQPCRYPCCMQHAWEPWLLLLSSVVKQIYNKITHFKKNIFKKWWRIINIIYDSFKLQNLKTQDFISKEEREKRNKNMEPRQNSDDDTTDNIRKISMIRLQRHKKNQQWWSEWVTPDDLYAFLPLVWLTLIIVDNISLCSWIHLVKIF